MARNKGDGLYERKRSNGTRSCWMYDVVIDGERFIRKIDGSLTRTEAKNLATTLRADYVKGIAGIRKRRDISFDDAADLFLKHARTNRKHRTVRYHGQTIAQLRKEFSGRKLSKITTFSVATYQRKRSVKAPVRVNREIAVLRLVFNKMLAWGKYEGTNPVAGIEFKPEPQNTIRFLDHDEEKRLLAECSEPLRTILILGIHCGLRIEAEALTPLTWRAIDFIQGSYGMLTVESRTEKTTKIRHIPLNEVAHQALKTIHERSTATGPDDPVFVNRFGKPLRSIRTVFERAREKAGLDARLPNGKHEVTIHIMRHTFASRLVMANVHPRTIQELGGWSSLKMLERYSHLSPGHLQEAVDSIATSGKKSHQNSQQLESKKRKA